VDDANPGQEPHAQQSTNKSIDEEEESDASEFELVGAPAPSTQPAPADENQETVPNLGSLARELAVDMAPVSIPGFAEEGELADESADEYTYVRFRVNLRC
jgi:hypothetical protein